MSNPATISSLLEQLFGLHLRSQPSTDEEWAERERQLAEAKDKPSDTELHDRQLATRKRIRLLEAAGCPPKRLEDAMSSAFRADAQAPVLLHGFPTTPDTGGVRVLSGGVGTGKTVAAVRWLFDHGGDAPLFVRAKALEAAGSFDRELRGKWQSCTAMVLDDLGVEHMDERGVFLGNLDELLDHFAGSRAPLVITTNLRKKRERPDEQPQFVERYGARIVSRLRQLEAWCNVRGGDMRAGGGTR